MQTSAASGQKRRAMELTSGRGPSPVSSAQPAEPAAKKTLPQTEDAFDVAIYGGTASGVVAAVAAAKNGARTALIVQGNHVGGMVSGGLGNTDVGKREVIGGLALKFYEEVARHYDAELWKWTGPEPHVAEAIFLRWLESAGVEVRFAEGHIRDAQVEDRRITTVETAGGAIEAKTWIDASYEGDLLAAAGVSYSVGREDREKYNERWAGRQPLRSLGRHDLQVVVDGMGEDGKPLPLINPKPMVPEGKGDGGVMAYGYRLTLVKGGEGRPIQMREGYDPARFEVLRRYLNGLTQYRKQEPELRDVLGIHPIPNGKSDVNSVGAISTNVLDGSSWAYPEAGPEERQKIADGHREYTHDLLWFLGNDPSVPPSLRNEVRQWGLPKDEYQDTGGWPHQLYVREARRMEGAYILTEHDLVEGRQPEDSVGMGSYHIDIREVQRVTDELHLHPNVVHTVYNEGYVSAPVPPYGIPFRALVPKEEEVENLIVPVAMSASHVAFSSVRMEPPWMILGESAGTAAALASESDAPVQRLDVGKLQEKLREAGQVLNDQDVRS